MQRFFKKIESLAKELKRQEGEFFKHNESAREKRFRKATLSIAIELLSELKDFKESNTRFLRLD